VKGELAAYRFFAGGDDAFLAGGLAVVGFGLAADALAGVVVVSVSIVRGAIGECLP
jgi:hypothetical protein